MNTCSFPAKFLSYFLALIGVADQVSEVFPCPPSCVIIHFAWQLTMLATVLSILSMLLTVTFLLSETPVHIFVCGSHHC